MKKGSQSGFTLIEMVVVIVILGILAVTAAPRMMGISSDAIVASMSSFKGAVKSANNLVFAKAIIEGLDEFEEATIETDTGKIITRFGYLSYSKAEPELSGEHLMAALDISLCHFQSSTCDNSEWSYNVSGNDVTFYHRNIIDRIKAGVSPDNTRCELTYSLPGEYGEDPTYKIVSEGC